MSAPLPPGYKLTEVGIIPEDWESSHFGKFIVSTQNGFGRRPNYIENGPIVLRLADVAQGLIDLSNTRRIEMTIDEFKKYKIDRDDLLFIRVNGSRDYIGRCVHVNQDYDEVAYNDHLIRVKVSERLYSKYVEYLFNTNPVRSALLSSIPIAIGGQLTINQTTLENTYVPLPPLAEQRAIADALTDVDSRITALDDLIAKKRDLKQGAMQRLLTGAERLPGFSGPWEVKKLGEIAAYIASGKSKCEINTDKYMVYGSTGILGYTNKADYFGEAILIARVGANAGKLNWVKGLYGVTDNTIILKLDNNQCLSFVWHQLQELNLNDLIFGSGQPLITGTQIKGINMWLPPLDEQAAIAAVLSDMDAEIAALEAERAKTAALKQGMMQDLLTGRVRLV